MTPFTTTVDRGSITHSGPNPLSSSSPSLPPSPVCLRSRPISLFPLTLHTSLCDPADSPSSPTHFPSLFLLPLSVSLFLQLFSTPLLLNVISLHFWYHIPPSLISFLPVYISFTPSRLSLPPFLPPSLSFLSSLSHPTSIPLSFSLSSLSMSLSLPTSHSFFIPTQPPTSLSSLPSPSPFPSLASEAPHLLTSDVIICFTGQG